MLNEHLAQLARSDSDFITLLKKYNEKADPALTPVEGQGSMRQWNLFFPLLFYSGLYPEDPLEAAFADAAVDAVGDNHMRLAPTVQEKDMTKKVRFGSTVSVLHVP